MSARFMKDRNASMGEAPGSLVFIGEKKIENVLRRLIDYDDETLVEETLEHVKDASLFIERPSTTWINVDGLHDADVIRRIGDLFGLHPLLLEDVMNTGQRPKIEEYDNCIFIVVKMVRFDDVAGRVFSEQLSLVLSRKFLLTFQERRGDTFEPVRERIRKSKGRIRSSGCDYLAYALLDTVVDNYIYAIERIGEDIEGLDQTILKDPKPELLEQIIGFKTEINYIRRAVRPAREAIIQLSKLDSELISEPVTPFLKDLLDLATQATDAVDLYREMLSDHLALYNGQVSNRLNDIMRVLTIFAAIFIPLTFIAGIYGTNFEYFPELHFRYAYFVFWGILALIGGSMVIYFRKKGWL